MKKEFYRIQRLPPYVLAEVTAMTAEARAAGRDIIDFGMGNPDRPAPPAYAALGSMEFAKRLLAEANVAVSPGIGFGEYGEGYLRLALVENEHRIRQAVRNIKAFFKRDQESGNIEPKAMAS